MRIKIATHGLDNCVLKKNVVYGETRYNDVMTS